MAEKDFIPGFEEFIKNCPWRYEDYKAEWVAPTFKCQATGQECTREDCAIFHICCAFSIDFD
jgi:hypothetical protein